MNIFVSNKIFFTKGIEGDKEFVHGIIPGLKFYKIESVSNKVMLKHLDTGSVIIVTDDMLDSNLFVNISE